MIFCLVQIKHLGHVQAAKALVDGPTRVRSGQAKSEELWLVGEGGEQCLLRPSARSFKTVPSDQFVF